MSFVLLVSLGSCATFPSATPYGSPRTIILDGDRISESDVGRFTSWYCKDFSYGGRTLVEVGFFGDPELQGVGFILYDGGYSGKSTSYQRRGLEHRWEWGLIGQYVFVIKTDGLGAYYDFSTVPTGESTKPREIYKCYQRK